MESLNDLLQQYYNFKREHSPYDYREWRTDGETAQKCKEILDLIAENIKSFLIDHGILNEGDFTVIKAEGAGYYPKLPWIGVLQKGESATNGVYPILGFYDDNKGPAGCFIGCVESFTNPQFGFQKKYCSDEECTEEEKGLLKQTGLKINVHLARMPKIFAAEKHIDTEALNNAFVQALAIYNKYRKEYPRIKFQDHNMSECGSSDTDMIQPTWYKEILIDDVAKWLNFIARHSSKRADGSPTWIFRGQGDSRWHLESSLSRQFGSTGDIKTLLKIERISICNFKREMFNSPLYQRLNGVNILAVMQHYGSVTRLLDFTFAPLTALFFAIEQRTSILSSINCYYKYHIGKSDSELSKINDGLSLAVWALYLPLLFRMDENVLDINETLSKSTSDAQKNIMQGSSDVNGNREQGIDVVLPRFGNERLSAQSGLFLMSRDVGVTFEENIRAAFNNYDEMTQADYNAENVSAIDWKKVVGKFGVLKFVFPANKVDELRTMLKSLRITYKTIYPDLVGIAKDSTPDVQSADTAP